MKKGLFATTAIVAAAAAVSMAPQNAAAQDDGGINLGVGGYYEFYYTASDQDEPQGQNNDFRTDRVRQEGEIEFSGDTTLDNGITVGVNVQLEAYTKGDQIDEHYAFVEGSFGRFQIGAENSAPYAMQVIAPSVGINANSPDYLPFSTQLGAFPTTVVGVSPGLTSGGSSDAPKLTYFTPRLAGFQLGASYAPDTQNTGGASQGAGLIQDEDAGVDQGRAYSLGANYTQSFNGVDVAASLGYETVEDDDDTAVTTTGGTTVVTSVFPTTTTTIGGTQTGTGVNNDDDFESYTAGLNIGYAGFTVGGSYLQNDDDAGDEQAYDLGVSYRTGPWGASVTWLHVDFDPNGTNAEPTHDTAVGSLTYALGPGITANANLHYFAEDADVQGGYDGDGYGASAGLMLSF